MQSSTGDLRGGQIGDWLVIGWFTPDYRPLAEGFAAHLAGRGVPYHLWERAKLAKVWNVIQKPSVVLESMDAYPGKTLILMDIDCVVQGDIAPIVAGTTGDVGITVHARNIRRGRKWQYAIAFDCSSRVVVFRPTAKARAFASRWAAEIEASTDIRHDEHSMAWAFITCPGVQFSFIDRRYSGREISDLPDAVICHDSLKGKEQREPPAWQAMLKVFERPFRSGQSKLRKHLQSEVPAPVKK
jgi:hypothetical protein